MAQGEGSDFKEQEEVKSQFHGCSVGAPIKNMFIDMNGNILIKLEPDCWIHTDVQTSTGGTGDTAVHAAQGSVKQWFVCKAAPLPLCFLSRFVEWWGDFLLSVLK